MKLKKKLTIITLVCLVIILPLIGSFLYLIMPISSGDRTFEVRISKGDTQPQILNKLDKLGAIKIPFIAKLYFDIKGLDGLKPGRYEFKTSDSVKSMIDSITSGNVGSSNIVMVTIPEGYSTTDIANILMKNGLITSKDSFMKEINQGDFSSYEFVNSIPKDRPARLEGYLYPDTYEFKKGSTNKDIILKMLDNFKDIAYLDVKEGAKKLSVTEDEIVRMASVVEKEARSDKERPIISGVFYNRIKLNMKLQSCATVLYALGEHKDKLYDKDLKIDSPYNTYKNPGLPVGAISNPGIKSLKAAINPSIHDYIYFVLQKNGEHFFTKDYNEFLKAKKASNTI